MHKIILDTNFLLIPYQFKVDIFSEIDRIITEAHILYVLDKTIDELHKIISDKNQKQADKQAAKLALALIQAKNIEIIKTHEDLFVDDLIVKQEGYIVATRDKNLKRRLKTKIITLRAEKKLILV
jgi:uncharacterized protein